MSGKERVMYYYNNELPPQQGWICPKCGRVNAPWMPTCDCVSSQTSGTGTSYLVKTSSISRDSHEIADTPQTERMKTHDYCDICNHKGCDNCISNNLDEYCVPSGYEPKDTPQTDCGWK